MRGIDGEQVLLRLILSESRRFDHKAMFMRIVGQSVGAAVFGAILNFGIYRRLPEAGEVVNRLMAPAARQTLGATEIAWLAEAVNTSLHVVYIIADLMAIISLVLALALPARLSPTRPYKSG